MQSDRCPVARREERREGPWRLLMLPLVFVIVTWGVIIVCGMPGCGASAVGSFKHGTGSLLDQVLVVAWRSTGVYERTPCERQEEVNLRSVDYTIDANLWKEDDDGAWIIPDGDRTARLKNGVLTRTVPDVEAPTWHLLAIHNVLAHVLLILPAVITALLAFRYVPLPSRAVDRSRCGACGYDLTGLPINRCPECGAEFETANTLGQRKGRYC